ncbi:MAG: FHA domain-containing protein [Deltaproteobacteria bacterium]|jgi:pSer/pThr/pTyr-binding forkhead associated (FHA) protein|nr:FHA domain-containing protein [Deltaproteobacteria bacterium]
MDDFKKCSACGMVQPDAPECRACGAPLIKIPRVGSTPSESTAQVKDSPSFIQTVTIDLDDPTISLQVNRQGRLIKLKSGDVIGRTACGAEQLMEFPSVSRLHARVIYENGQWLVEDLDSANGLYVDGRRFERVFLNIGSSFFLSQSCELTVVSC